MFVVAQTGQVFALSTATGGVVWTYFVHWFLDEWAGACSLAA